LIEINRYHGKALEEGTASRVNKKLENEPEHYELSKRDVRLLLIVCTELVNLCAQLTGKIDPAAAAMLAYVRDDTRSENE
jgi:hypothetical protein